MLPLSRATHKEVAITIPSAQTDLEANIVNKTPNGSPSNDLADLKESGPLVLSRSDEYIDTVGSSARSAMQEPCSFKSEDDYDAEEIYKKIELKKEGDKRLRVGILIEWVAALGILGCFIVSVSIKELRDIVIWDLKFWKWCLLLNLVFCGMFIANWFMHFVVFLNKRNFMSRMKDLPFVHRLQRSVQVFVWIGFLLLGWVLLLIHGVKRSKEVQKIMNQVTWTLISALVGSFLWLLKTLSLEILESKFRVDTFFGRIQESLFCEYVLKTLSGPPAEGEAVTGTLSLRSMKNDKGTKDKVVIDMAKLHRMKKQEITGWTMKVLVHHFTSSGPSIVSNTVEESDEERSEASNKEISIENEIESIAAAHRIFRNVAKPGCKYIEEEDLLRFITKEEVDRIFPLFSGFETGRIDKKALTDWVVKVHHDWKVLTFTLNDTRRAITQLNRVVSGVLVVTDFIIWLLLMKITTPETIAIFFTAAAFAFSNTFKTVFESAVFIFGVHPFDVGDCCVVDGIPLVVEEMDILTTVFLKPDREKVYYPNSVLAMMPISNYYRSPDMGESLEFSIPFAMPLERIAKLKERIKKYFEMTPQNWHPNHSIEIKETEDENKLKMTLHCNHTMNFQDLEEKNRRRSQLVIEMKKIYEELNMQCSMAKQEP